MDTNCQLYSSINNLIFKGEQLPGVGITKSSSVISLGSMIILLSKLETAILLYNAITNYVNKQPTKYHDNNSNIICYTELY